MCAMRHDDMSQVQKWGENVPEGWYHVKIEKTEERESKETPGEYVQWFWLKVQNEPHVGRLIMDKMSLQKHALAKLKAYYEACGYKPGPEGHDPDQIVGGELFVKVTDTVYKGDKRQDIAPFNIRSLSEGIPAGQ